MSASPLRAPWVEMKYSITVSVVQTKSIQDAMAALDLEALEILQAMQLKRVILSALMKNEHNVKQTAAAALKVKRTTLSSKMKVLKILDSGSY